MLGAFLEKFKSHLVHLVLQSHTVGEGRVTVSFPQGALETGFGEHV